MPGTALVLIVSYLMAKSTPWEVQRSVQPVSKKIHTPASRRVRKAMGAGQAELLQGLEIDLARRPAGSEKIGAPGGMDKIYCSSWPNMIAAALQ
jgi:hypothetical protein